MLPVDWNEIRLVIGLKILARMIRDTHHLEKGEIGVQHIVKIDHWIVPREIGFGTGFTILYEWCVHSLARFLVNARIEFAGEHLDAHDWKDEPKYETDQQHIENGGYCLYQGVHHHLWTHPKDQSIGRPPSPHG